MLLSFLKGLLPHRHAWTRWSKPHATQGQWIWGSTFETTVQVRQCDSCGKVEVREVG